MAAENDPPLNSNCMIRDGLPELGTIRASNDFVVSVFKPEGSKLIGPRIGPIDRGVFGDEAAFSGFKLPNWLPEP